MAACSSTAQPRETKWCVFLMFLQVFAQFESFLKAVSLHLVEASPHLSTLQEDTLRGQLAKGEQAHANHGYPISGALA